MSPSESYNPIGVIDIGSNSVRLVIFDGLKRHVRPIFNEKMLCGLGENLGTTGRLPEDGKAEAARCFARYVQLAKALPVSELRIIATAAIRDAADGPEFMRQLSAENAVEIEVIPGEEEARLAALGVFATVYQPKGLAGDLGGGSLELIDLKPESIGDRISLPLGVLRLWQQSGGDPVAIRKLIDQQLDEQPWLDGDYQRFYAIGGSFRMLARVHMRRVDYPLRMLHHYRIEKRELKRFTEDMLRLNLHAIASLKGMPADRSHMLVPGLLVLERVMDRGKCDEAIFCTGGIREGLFYDELSREEQRQDPLLAYVLDILPEHRIGDYARTLVDWLSPLTLLAGDVSQRMVEAFCYLSDTALGMHPEYRAQWAYDLMLYSSCTGITHKERVWLALALYHRYRAKLRLEAPCLKLLTDAERASARLVGVGAALAHAISGGGASLLSAVSLAEDKGRITLKNSGEALLTDTETLEKLLEGLGEAAKALESRTK